MSEAGTVHETEPTMFGPPPTWIRILALTGTAAIAGALLYRAFAGTVAGQPVWLFAAFLYAAAIGVTAVLTYRYAPRFGPFMESTAIARLLLAGASVAIPGIAGAMTASPVLNASLIVGTAAVLQTLRPARRRARLPGMAQSV